MGTMHRNTCTSAHHNTVQQRNIWLWKTSDARIETIFVTEKIECRRAILSRLVGRNHIAASAEGTALTLKNHTGDVWIGFPGLKRAVESKNHIMRERVERRCAR
ncbi:hypothetical protein D9M69_575990 [compost metagenome]